MNMQETLSTLDKVLGIKPPKIVKMTKAAFEKHVASELQKAKAEAEETDKEKGAAKAKKRLEFLRATMKLAIAKASWEGGNGEAAIPVYEEGYEPPTEMPTEMERPATFQGDGGTNADGASFASAKGVQSFGDSSMGGAKTASGTQVPASGAGTQADGASFAAAGGTQSFAKGLEELTATLKSLGGQAPAKQPANEVPAPPQGHVDDPSVWPRDLANPDFLKEGVAKRAETWGTDPWAPTK
jgi:hypothetical protein